MALLIDDVLRNAGARVTQGDDVPGNGAHDDEGQDRDADQRRDHQQEPPDHVAPHRR